MIKVSIISSVYNCEQYIAEMIESILNQKYKCWELIIVDDSSQDRTAEIINSYRDKRIKLIRNNKNLGLTHNLNVAMSIAQGKYIARIDGDDVAYSDRLEKQIDYMENHPDIVLSGCWIKSFGKEHVFRQRVTDDKTLRAQLVFDPVLFHPTFIFRKDVVDKNHICYNENLQYAQDYRFTYDMSRCGKIGNLSEILLMYRVHDNQISNERYAEQTKCANQTRQKILRDMGILLSDNQLESWYKFCLYQVLSETDKKNIEDICKKIKEWNKNTHYYDMELLELLLEMKYKENNQQGVLPNDVCKVNKYQELYMLLLRYINIKDSRCVYKYLSRKGYKKVAIYGTSYVARLIYNDLKKEKDIKILYGIDRNPISNYIEDGFDICQLSEHLDEVDVIIVTPVYAINDIKKNINQYINTDIISLDEIFDGV